MAKAKRDPRVLFGFVTAVTAMLIFTGKGVGWAMEDKSRFPLLIAPLLLLICGVIGYRWWVKTRHEEWVKSGGREQARVGTGTRRCRKCGSPLEGVEPKPVSIGGLNVVRVVCPKCGKVEG